MDALQRQDRPKNVYGGRAVTNVDVLVDGRHVEIISLQLFLRGQAFLAVSALGSSRGTFGYCSESRRRADCIQKLYVLRTVSE